MGEGCSMQRARSGFAKAAHVLAPVSPQRKIITSEQTPLPHRYSLPPTQKYSPRPNWRHGHHQQTGIGAVP